ncbi:MAG: hypothetical protein IPM47_01540 [Sphingobacteriales bacterium]|nr:MAG: hypothetical protein IPM47_01540 [Sphingobacteriales bacterium]
MFNPENLPDSLLTLRQNLQEPEIFEVDLNCLDLVKQHYDQLECHLVLYPYSRKIASKRYHFTPFEEYIQDIANRHRSAYRPISEKMNKTFGLILGGAIAIIFAGLKPDDLFSVESVVSVFGAYLLGKDLWTDIDHFLINTTKNSRLRYTDSYYYYELEKNTTLTQYSHFARQQRYGKQQLLPQKLDFIENSNSQTLRMLFETKEWKKSIDPSAHILTLRFSSKILSHLHEEGFMLGVKWSFNRRHQLICQHFEVFQSLHKQTPGCINEQGEWKDNAFFYRKTFTIGRLKYFASAGMIDRATSLINYQTI